MEAIQSRLEAWVRAQGAKMMKVLLGPLQWRMKWPPWDSGDRDQRKRLQDRHRIQLADLCLSLKAESFSDLRDLLCSMVLSECVYKRPSTELVRSENKFKADFGGQIVSLDRVQQYQQLRFGSLSVFSSMPSREIISWNSIICGLAQHREAERALEIFEEMRSEASLVEPNHITFVGVLSACSHAGWLSKGDITSPSWTAMEIKFKQNN